VVKHETTCRTVLRCGMAAATLIAGAQMSGVASAQIKPAMVRSVDEPARVPYGGTVAFSCPFGNDCTVEYPVVAAGKRVRITDVTIAIPAQSTATHFLAVHRNGASFATMLSVFPMAPISAAFYGQMVSTTQSLNVYFEAGDKPVVELFVTAGSGGINASQARVTLTGYVVDTAP
jgi:hypothetical protein